MKIPVSSFVGLFSLNHLFDWHHLSYILGKGRVTIFLIVLLNQYPLHQGIFVNSTLKLSLGIFYLSLLHRIVVFYPSLPPK